VRELGYLGCRNTCNIPKIRRQNSKCNEWSGIRRQRKKNNHEQAVSRVGELCQKMMTVIASTSERAEIFASAAIKGATGDRTANPTRLGLGRAAQGGTTLVPGLRLNNLSKRGKCIPKKLTCRGSDRLIRTLGKNKYRVSARICSDYNKRIKLSKKGQRPGRGQGSRRGRENKVWHEWALTE